MSLSEVANIATAIALLPTAAGLVITAFQMRGAARTSRAQFLHGLEVDAQRFQPLFESLLPLGAPLSAAQSEALHKDELMVFSALNFFEKLDLLIQNRSVDLQSIDMLFSGRFFLLVHSPVVQSSILLAPQYKGYFHAVAHLYRILYRYRDGRGLPIALRENAIEEYVKPSQER